MDAVDIVRGGDGTPHVPRKEGVGSQDARVQDVAAAALRPQDREAPRAIRSPKQAYEALQDKSKEAIIAFVRQCPAGLEHVGREMQEDIDVVKAAIESDPNVLKFGSHRVQHQLVKDDPPLVLTCSCQSDFYASKPQMMLLVKDNSDLFIEAPVELRLDAEFVLEAVKVHPQLYTGLFDQMKGNLPIATIAIESDHQLIHWAPLYVRLELGKKMPQLLKLEEFRGDKGSLGTVEEAEFDYLMFGGGKDESAAVGTIDFEEAHEETLMSRFGKIEERWEEDEPKSLEDFLFGDAAEWEDDPAAEELSKPSLSVENYQIAVQIDPEYFRSAPEAIKTNPLVVEAYISAFKKETMEDVPEEAIAAYLTKHPDEILLFYNTISSIPKALLANAEVVLAICQKGWNVVIEFDDAQLLPLVKTAPALLPFSAWVVMKREIPRELFDDKECRRLIVQYAPEQYLRVLGRFSGSIKQARRLVNSHPHWINVLEPKMQEEILYGQPQLLHALSLDIKFPSLSKRILESEPHINVLMAAAPHIALEQMDPKSEVQCRLCKKYIPFYLKPDLAGAPEGSMLHYAQGVIQQRIDDLPDDECESIQLQIRLIHSVFDLTSPLERRLVDRLVKKLSPSRFNMILGKIQSRPWIIRSNAAFLDTLSGANLPLALVILSEDDSSDRIDTALKAVSQLDKGRYRDSRTGLQRATLRLAMQLLKNSSENFDRLFEAILHRVAAHPEDNGAPLLDAISSLYDTLPHDVVEEQIDLILAEEGTLEQIVEKIHRSVRFLGIDVEGVERILEFPRACDALFHLVKVNYHKKENVSSIYQLIQMGCDKTFVSSRSNPSGNDHLTRLERESPTIFEQWIALHGETMRMDDVEVEISDDWQDFVMMGVEVTGSCQNVYQNGSSHALGVLGVAMDGRDHLLVVRNEEGKIASRAVLRQIFTDDGPALILNASYHSTTRNDKHSAALLASAQKIAQNLGIPLYGGPYSKYEIETKRVDVACHCEAGRAEWTYDDTRHALVNHEAFNPVVTTDLSA